MLFRARLIGDLEPAIVSDVSEIQVDSLRRCSRPKHELAKSRTHCASSAWCVWTSKFEGIKCDGLR